jgi:transcription elongation factor GreA
VTPNRIDELEALQSPPAALLLTPEGYANLQEELEHLTMVKRAEIAERLRDSKQHGEFSEDNHELDEVKFDQALVENRIADLKTIFASAQVLDPAAISTEVAGIGAWVTVRNEDRGTEFEVRLVASIEADPDLDMISVESPMGQAILGKRQGDVAVFVAPAGKIRLRIVNIRR